MDECDLEESTEIDRGLLVPRKDTTAFLEPADQSFDDVAVSVCLAVKLNETFLAILVFFCGNDWCDFQIQQVFVDPLCPVSFVASQRHWPGNGIAVFIEQALIGTPQEGFERCGFMRLTGCQLKVERIAVAITKEMDFCRKTPARAA